MKIAFIPIDNRPVCYTLPEQIAKLNTDIEFFMPERELLGDLTKYADTEKLFDWLSDLPEADAVILSLDTAAYGGLIPSRRCEDTFAQIKSKIERLKDILLRKNAKIYAFSSIMRISNNNINEEEKEYWNKWGKKIFDYSYHTHKLGCESCITNVIPSEILDDYLETRKRNFEINKIYLQWQKQGFFETLIFSKDDCAEYGFNVQEAEILQSMGGCVKTGADEIPLSLLARAVNTKIKIAPVFIEPECINLISNYEDISIEKSVRGQIELCGCEVSSSENADILLYVNNFKEHQGEIVMKRNTEPFSGIWNKPEKPYMTADVRYANGADNNLVRQILSKGIDENFFGYSAWNTSANTLGSLICTAKMFASNNKNTAKEEFKQLQTIRLLDDWAYQANVRQTMTSPDTEELKEKMRPYEEKVFDFLDFHAKIEYKFPWNRLFEVEIILK